MVKSKKAATSIAFNKKAAMELSIGTIVILVLAMTMLILGLVLVRTIFKGATESVDELNDKVRGEITILFADEGSNIVVKLGSDKTARVKQDTNNFGVGFGAKTKDGSTVNINELKYKLTLDTSARENCIIILGESKVKSFIQQRTDEWLSFDEFEGDAAFAKVQIDIPDGTVLCSQKVFIDVQDRGEEIGRKAFTIEVIRKGFF